MNAKNIGSIQNTINKLISKMENYTIEQIKKAFWETFHESGELWFNYLGTDEDNNESTDNEWLDFKENLKQTNI
jgi:hypothetical protein